MKMTFAVILVVISLTLGACKELDQTSKEILGTWELASYKYGSSQSGFTDSPVKSRGRLKLITETHFTWVDFDKTTRKIFSSAGGTYLLNGNTYTESIDFGTGMNRYLNNKHEFTIKVEGDMFFLSGSLADGLKIEEIWQRVDEEPSSTTVTTQKVTEPTKKDIRVYILNEEEKPLKGVNLLVTGTQIREIADSSGLIKIENVPKEAFIVSSYKGYITQVLKPDFSSEVSVKMEKDPDYKERGTAGTYSNQLVVIDGLVSDIKAPDIFSKMGDEIAKVTQLKGKEATDKYGEKGKDGVIEIMSLKKAAELGIKIPFRRRKPEDYPTFRGEKHTTFTEWVISRIKYPPEAIEKGIEGRVHVSYTVEKDGSLSNIRINGSPDPLLGNVIVKAVQSSPAWEPPQNPEATEPFISEVSVKFELPDKISGVPAFVVVEVMPMFPGGDAELLKFIAENTQYPFEAKTKGIQGRVIVRFIVNSKGEAEDAVVLKGVNPLLDAEAVRVVNMLPDFKPGYQGGMPVDVYYMVPISFTLK